MDRPLFGSKLQFLRLSNITCEKSCLNLKTQLSHPSLLKASLTSLPTVPTLDHTWSPAPGWELSEGCTCSPRAQNRARQGVGGGVGRTSTCFISWEEGRARAWASLLPPALERCWSSPWPIKTHCPLKNVGGTSLLLCLLSRRGSKKCWAILTPLWQPEGRTPGVVPSTLGPMAASQAGPGAPACAASRACGKLWTPSSSARPTNGAMKGPVEQQPRGRVKGEVGPGR